MEPKTNVDQLPLPRPAFIELQGDGFICKPCLKDEEVDYTGIDQLLAMTPDERLEWNEAWRLFIRQCERQGWTPERIAAMIWGETRADEPG